MQLERGYLQELSRWTIESNVRSDSAGNGNGNAVWGEEEWPKASSFYGLKQSVTGE